MNAIKKYVVILSTLVCLTNCSSILYKQDISQGIYPNSDLVAKLKQGMTKEEVIKLLGEPTLTNPVYPNKWAYVATYEEGFEIVTKKKLLIEFKDNKVKKFTN